MSIRQIIHDATRKPLFTYYVVGFLFTEKRDFVYLIRKERPAWQKGLLNGIGGHVEPTDKSFAAAMAREFKEETGADVPAEKWKLFSKLVGPGYCCYCFKATADVIAVSQTDERVMLAPLESDTLPPFVLFPYQPIRNLRYLVSLALDDEQVGIPVFTFNGTPTK